MRKLASIRRIEYLEPIEKADKLELATVDGWKSVVKKDQFRIGDLVIYFECDSFLPIHPKFEFLRTNCYRNVPGLGEGFRLKSVRLRGTLSQGLILPITDFELTFENLVVGCDVTSILGVKLYEQPEPGTTTTSAQQAGNFPSFIRKTDQERVQNRTDLFSNLYTATEKIDGCSATYYHLAGKVGLCSRNFELKLDSETSSVWHTINQKYHILDALQKLNKNLAIQGEIVGPGIQKNPYKFKELKFFIYSIFSIDQHRYLSNKEKRDIYEDLNALGYNLETVPEFSTINIGAESLESMLRRADGPSKLNPEVSREGLVFHKLDGKDSFKVISNKWLLETEN